MIVRHSIRLVATSCIAALCMTNAYANVYLDTNQAQALMFGTTKLTPVSIQLSDQIRTTMQERSSVHEPFRTDRIWRSADGGYFIIDEVVGKHEHIKYAVGINPDGTVKLIDIMEYTESYGDEVRQATWRSQFIGKTSSDAIKLNKDIQNISGATLSCKHLADGVKRVMTMYELALKPLK